MLQVSALYDWGLIISSSIYPLALTGVCRGKGVLNTIPVKDESAPVTC